MVGGLSPTPLVVGLSNPTLLCHYMLVTLLYCHQEYIIQKERESIALIAQPCEKYLSWEDGEKYMLDHKAVHKAHHVNSDTLTYWSSREIFYTKTVILRSTVTMKLTWSSPSYLTSQSEIQLFLDRQIPSQHSGEMPQILKF